MVALVFADDIAVNVVLVGMVVRINREAIGDARAEKRQIGRVVAYRFGLAVAADVMIQTDHLVG